MKLLLLLLLVSTNLLAATLPDRKLTPGATDPAVTQANVKTTICVPGYTSKVRNVPQSVKREAYARYKLQNVPGKYEVDHLISLELGGSNSILNLWPEPYEPRPGAHEKDEVENYLHKQICAGKISLKEAQTRISTDWYSARSTVSLHWL
jgi:hypothetical protein